MEVSGDEILIHLFPRTQSGRELRRIVSAILEQVNEARLERPILPGRRLRLRLGQRAELELNLRIGR